jgi:hypothetical protein
MMMNAIQRAEYTIGVSGCGARKTFIVICPEESDGCFAAGPRSIHPGVVTLRSDRGLNIHSGM